MAAAGAQAQGDDQPACALETPNAITIAHQPFARRSVATDERLRVRNDTDAACLAEIDLTRIDGTPLPLVFTHAAFAIDLVQIGAGARIVADGLGGFRIEVPPQTVAEYQIAFAALDDRPVPAGEEAAVLRVGFALAAQDADAGDVETAFETTVTLASPSVAEIRVGRAPGSVERRDAPLLLDFGALTTGATRSAYMQVNATSPARLTIRAENGALVRTDDARERVPYRLRLNGQALPLDAPTQRMIDNGAAVFGDVMRLRFELGDAEGVGAGTYRDTVHLEVEVF